MRVLCGIDLLAGSGAGLTRRVQGLAAGAVDALVLVHVIDPGPRRDVARQLAVRRLLAHPSAESARTQAMAAAEETAGREALAEAVAVAHERGIPVETRLEWGKPEQVLVRLAQDLEVDLLVVRARERGAVGVGALGRGPRPHPHPHLRPEVGPGSVGHTARFVLDHASCDVLLVRVDSGSAGEGAQRYEERTLYLGDTGDAAVAQTAARRSRPHACGALGAHLRECYMGSRAPSGDG